MADSKQRQEKLKLALIPVLVVGLIAVLMQGDTEESSPVPELIQPLNRLAVKSLPENSTGDEQPGRDVVWPSFSLTTIMAHDPFELKDPRAMLDADMLAAGITGDERMTEVSAADFFPQEDFIDLEAEAAFLAALMEWTNPATTTDDAANDARPTAADPNDSPVASIEADSKEPDPEQLAIAEQERQTTIQRERRSADLQQRLKSLQNQPVTMIMTSVRGTSALFGGRKIMEGELVEDGIRVASIDRRGITFEIVETPDM